ncbi:MAG: Gfo/Idh/MocA family oxidoreductase [Chloroflexota bacterium]|nr:MAG: Gfo/Idh/MocA family oxidoreductase [Chloroflexota bacterium]
MAEQGVGVTKRARVGIVGLDHWYAGLGAAEELSKNAGVELVAIAHRHEKRGRDTAEKYGAEFTTDYLSVASRNDLDVVVTACYCSENPAMVAAAAKAGNHVASVKPIAMTVDGADAIRSAVKAAGVSFMSFESNYRVNPTFLDIKSWVDAGRIGKVITAATVLRSMLPTQEWPGERGRTWWLDSAKSPGGGWIDHSIYHIDFLRWLLNDEVATVSGDSGNVKHTDIAPLEDYGAANLAFRGGARATIEVTWTASPGSFVHRIELTGTEGHIIWDPSVTGKTLIGAKNDPAGWLHIASPPRPSGAANHVVEMAMTKHATAGTVEDARTNLNVCEQFYRAAKTGQRIAL